MFDTDSLKSYPAQKNSSLLPTNSDQIGLPFDEAWSEFVGRRAGDEGNTDSKNLDKLSRLRRERDTQFAELRMENRLLVSPGRDLPGRPCVFFNLALISSISWPSFSKSFC
ncbi:MAG: hypothetical protein ACI87E_001510 [Mariniblastus sp.]|jgi:hypothetical protein